MADGKLNYEIDGDSTKLQNAMARAQATGAKLGSDINQKFSSLPGVMQGVAAVMALHAAFERSRAAVAAAKEQIDAYGRASSSISMGGLNAQLNQAVSHMEKLRNEVQQMSSWQAAWEQIQNFVTGTNVRVEQYKAANDAALKSQDGIVARLGEQVAVQNLLNAGKEKEAALLQTAQKYSQQIAELEGQKKAAQPSLAAGYDAQIAKLRELQAAEAAGIAKKFDAEAASKAKLDEQITAASQLRTEAESLDQVFAEQAAQLSESAKATYSQAVGMEANVRLSQAAADYYSNGAASQKRLEETTKTIGEHFGTQATMVDRLKTAMGIIRGNVEESARFWGTIVEKATAAVEKVGTLNIDLGKMRNITGEIVTASVQHTAQVELSGKAMAALNGNGEATLRTLRSMLTELRSITAQAQMASQQGVVLG
jgi:hypothetical protein